MISKPLGIRVAHVEADGDFDTHDNQKSLTGSLADVSECLAAFQADLEARGVSGRTVTLVWSEFGRRPRRTARAPTTAPAGSPGCRATGRGRGSTASTRASSQLDRSDNLKVTIDFRRVYSSLLEQHLGADAASVIPNARRLGRVPLLK